jgi:DNA-binding transcriptional ArsR family regulator
VNALAAIADPTRRRIVELLAEGDRTAGDLAAQFDAARPGVSRHLRVLREHGLVSVRAEGRRRVYSLDPRPLDDLDAWLTHYRAFWQNRLDALDTEIRRRRRTK